jgi:T5SS/PEP-CTERM-associated repeat protein
MGADRSCFVAAAVIAAVAVPPAGAATRYRSLDGGCATADWLGTASATCWAANAGGAPTAAWPTAVDDVYLLAPDATATTLVTLVGAGRAPFTAVARELVLAGNASVAAGLAVNGALTVNQLVLGKANSADLGQVLQTNGLVQADKLAVLGGSYTRADGALRLGALDVHSQKAEALFSLGIGGEATLGRVSVGSAGARDATLLLNWNATMDTLTVGALEGTGQARVQVPLATLRVADVTVGARGHGSFEMAAMGAIEAGTLRIGEREGVQGRFAANGSFAYIKIDRLVVGEGGSGDFALAGTSISPSSAFGLWVSGGTVIGAARPGVGTLTIDRHYWTRGGGTVVGDAGSGTLVLRDGTVSLEPISAADLTTVARQAHSNGSFTITGASQVRGKQLVVGDAGQGQMLVDDRSTAAFDGIVIGAAASGVGNVTVRAALTAQTLKIGGLGSGTLTVGGGGFASIAGLTEAGAAGRLVLDGGRLDSRSVGFGRAGAIDWRSGTLNVTGGVALDGVALPTTLVVPQGGRLQTTTLTVGRGSVLTLAGGTVAADTLAFDGEIVGSGALQALVRGSRDSRIAATGALTLGLANRADSYAYGGLLDVGSARVTLLDADGAELGPQTRIGHGGELVAANGVTLGPAAALVAAGDGRIAARVVLAGGEIFSFGGATLTFGGDVAGDATFIADLRFERGYTLGASRENHFNDGELTFAAGSTLTLAIDGTRLRDDFDRLAGIGRLAFDGRLVLDFGTGFDAAPGTRIDLFDFAAFSGRLDAGTIVVDGYDRARLDFSRLAIDGTIGVVPEPGGGALFAAGLAVLAGFSCLRRNRR